METFFAGLLGFLVGRGVSPKDADAIVEALHQYLGFEPPVGLTGYSLYDLPAGKQQKSSVVVRGKIYDARAMSELSKFDEVSVLGRTGTFLDIAPTITRIKVIEAMKAEGYSIEADILRAEDNTEVDNDSATTNWILAKTIGIYGLTASKCMDKLLYACHKAAEAGSVYVRITTRAYPADPITQVEEEVTALTYDMGIKVKEIEPVYAPYCTIFVYLKGDGVLLNAVYNREMIGYGSTKVDISYT